MADGFEYININHAVMIWHKDCYMVIWILIALSLKRKCTSGASATRGRGVGRNEKSVCLVDETENK
jgi:hypothetical protein